MTLQLELFEELLFLLQNPIDQANVHFLSTDSHRLRYYLEAKIRDSFPASAIHVIRIGENRLNLPRFLHESSFSKGEILFIFNIELKEFRNRILQYLNIGREFLTECPASLIFWTTPEMLNHLATRAGDVWSFRTQSYSFQKEAFPVGQENPISPTEWKQIFSLVSLDKETSLDFSGEGISDLPGECLLEEDLSLLRELNLAQNQLSLLPPEINRLTELRILNLRENRFTELPPSLGDLSYLRELNLYGNQIRRLPQEIGSLSQLEMLAVSENPLEFPPPEILVRDMSEVLRFLRAPEYLDSGVLRFSEEFRKTTGTTKKKFSPDCPSVFVLRPHKTKDWIGNPLDQTLELQLYCQAPGEWHPAPEGGFYLSQENDAWLPPLAERISQIAETLKENPPQFGSWVGTSRKAFEKEMQQNGDIMEKLATLLARDSFSSPPRQQKLWEAFQVFLTSIDQHQHWGGLKKAHTLQGEDLWLCDYHAKVFGGFSSQLKKGGIQLDNFPTTTSQLFGREEELIQLTKSLNSPFPNIITLIAQGGEGKTSLTNHWLIQLQKTNYQGITHLFAYSFYSQGAKEDRQVSADPFFTQILTFFQDPKPNEGASTQKAERLLSYLQSHPTLLILDGLEPLQHPSTNPLKGKLKDPGLHFLLRRLSIQPGKEGSLCLITTRLSLQDLKTCETQGVKKIVLKNLSEESGEKLLKHLGVKGEPTERKKTTKEYKGHALSLTLLATYLKEAYRGDLKHKIPTEPLLDEKKQTSYHCKKVLQSYRVWFQNQPEETLLNRLGLFDRPVEETTLKLLLPLSEKDFQRTLSHLKGLYLITQEKSRIDTHPIIREFFSENFRKQSPEDWQKAQEILYDHYKNLPQKPQPDSLEEMEPLFQAIQHGCQAGKHQEVAVEIYWERIRRKDKGYLIHQLGAYGSNLSALANFFEIPWSHPSPNLTEEWQAVILSWAGFSLRALGRFQEAQQSFNAVLKSDIKRKFWKGAAKSASNLSELTLTMGSLSQSLEYAQESVSYADQSDDGLLHQESKRTTLADSFHQLGQIQKAQELFEEAENRQKKRDPESPYLPSLRGFRYCDLLLSQGKSEEALQRATQTIEYRKEDWYSLLAIALDRLTLARAHSDLTPKKDHFEKAITDLREAGQQDYLTRGLIHRSLFLTTQNLFEESQRDLNEAIEIAETGSMKLHLADAYLASTRLQLTQNNLNKAKSFLTQAKTFIEEMGYHRRDKEVRELEKQLNP